MIGSNDANDKQVLGEGKGPELDIQGGRHPMLEFSMSQRYIYRKILYLNDDDDDLKKSRK